MKRIIPILVIILLIIGSLGAVAISNKEIDNDKEILESVILSDIKIINSEEFSSVKLDEATSYTLETGNPMVPKITKTYEIPIGSKITDVSVQFSQKIKTNLFNEIELAPEPVIDGTDKKVKNYVSEIELNYLNDIYPENNFEYKTSTGLSGDKRVIFLSVQIYPVQYNTKEKSVYYSNSFEIDIKYNPPENPVTFLDTYDLLIISPSDFTNELQPLVNHKNSFEIETMTKTLDEIYSEYPEGRDDAEKIKFFIHDAIDPDGLNLGIKYVLLVGGMVDQNQEVWYTPVRYVRTPNEDAFLCDLYFSDIYKDDGTTFDDWDSNGDGIIGEWGTLVGHKDTFDGAPDVYIGRLACRNEGDVTIMVNKIINYEKTKAAESWYKNMLLIGGDTYPDYGPLGAYEAEIDTDVSAGYMDGFSFVRLWASLGTLTGQSSVEDEINKGVGFVHMAGHANPSILVTHPPDAPKTEKITILRMYAIPFIDAIYALFYQNKGFEGFIQALLSPINPRLKNNNKLPIMLIGGCHNSQFNVSIKNIITDGFNHAYGWGHHGPKSFSWWLTVKENGGAIATMGNSGFGMGIPGFNYPDGLDGWLLPRFYYNYGQMGEEYLGAAHSAAITDYVNEFNINTDPEDRQMVQQLILLGDPSLMMGGYE